MKRANQLKAAMIPVSLILILVSFAIILIAPAAIGGDIKIQVPWQKAEVAIMSWSEKSYRMRLLKLVSNYLLVS